ncbi:hypothetical protein [Pseudomarimonas salicorniae]|uniref:Uncharacterized protein n=1 Tax=Pseudomarimonas salicorniae TaxID=2933270 RepID=A0ABT0GFD5_9GAMM|nr:hypothetical protein [Lysobacter sp. CAU 1642]MCK7593253.1 hypothetical protein [Lysobacter sp. CAU 1642]
MTVLCIEELTEADLRVLANHNRSKPAPAPRPLTVASPERAAANEVPACKAELPSLAMPSVPAMAGGVS